MTTINKRIELIIKYLDISNRDFAVSIQESPSWISSTINVMKPTKPEFERVAKIYKVYPSISPHWLLTGDGEMLNSKEKILSIQNNRNGDGDGNEMTVTNNTSECENELKHLRELLVEKERTIQEKERLIQFLMKDKQS